MLDPSVPASITPYYGPWTVFTSDGELLLSATTQEEALRLAKAQLPEGSILAIDAARCVVTFVLPHPIEAQVTERIKSNIDLAVDI